MTSLQHDSQEEEGNNFYMIEEGELIATKGEGKLK